MTEIDLTMVDQTKCAVVTDGVVCGRKIRGYGFCAAHFLRLTRHGDVRADQPIRPYQPQQPCSVARCSRTVKALGLCCMHYQRTRKGIPLAGSPAWVPFKDYEIRRLESYLDVTPGRAGYGEVAELAMAMGRPKISVSAKLTALRRTRREAQNRKLCG